MRAFDAGSKVKGWVGSEVLEAGIDIGRGREQLMTAVTDSEQIIEELPADT